MGEKKNVKLKTAQHHKVISLRTVIPSSCCSSVCVLIRVLLGVSYISYKITTRTITQARLTNDCTLIMIHYTYLHRDNKKKVLLFPNQALGQSTTSTTICSSMLYIRHIRVYAKSVHNLTTTTTTTHIETTTTTTTHSTYNFDFTTNVPM